MPRRPLTVRIVHTSALEHTADGQPDRYIDTRVEFGREALTQGLLDRVRPTALKILLALATHVRPLVGQELEQAITLGLASPADAGQLFTFVTDLALADELRMSRNTVRDALAQWQDEGLIAIHARTGEPVRSLDGRYQIQRLVILSEGSGEARRIGDGEEGAPTVKPPARSAASSGKSRWQWLSISIGLKPSLDARTS